MLPKARTERNALTTGLQRAIEAGITAVGICMKATACMSKKTATTTRTTTIRAATTAAAQSVPATDEPPDNSLDYDRCHALGGAAVAPVPVSEHARSLRGQMNIYAKRRKGHSMPTSRYQVGHLDCMLNNAQGTDKIVGLTSSTWRKVLG